MSKNNKLSLLKMKIDEQMCSLNENARNTQNSYKTILVHNLKKLQSGKHQKIKKSGDKVFEIGKCASGTLIDMVYLKGNRSFKMNSSFAINFGYDEITKIFNIDTQLPSPENLYKEKSYSYSKSRCDIVTKYLSDKEFNKIYDEVISQIILLQFAIVYKIDQFALIDSLVVNGYVDGLDKSNGKSIRNCIISVKIPSDKFNDLDLEKLDAKECLKSFKARVAGEFINISPVTPMLKFDKKDNRLIEVEDIINELSESTNLALMEWEKFEYIVRDLFSKMFSESGADVKVTQSSRDRGVDAIVFDPDPIRGGKFIIQCKRYNNVVGVSDVRDLWGTVMHEGASKGILVTTSHFGKDSIEWSKDKPITLINGNNLLSLFQKYGYNFIIKLNR